MKVLETARLVLRRLDTEDASFMFRLLNDPSWIQNIGDKGIRTLDDAKDYIRNGPVVMYMRYGFGLFLVQLKDSQTSIGLCGLIKRKALKDVDIGYAFLPEYWGKGYAMDSASAVISYGKSIHRLSRLVGITLPSNHSSVKLLKKLGFQFESIVMMTADTEELEIYSIEL